MPIKRIADCFSDQEFKKFISVIDDERAKIAFLLGAYCGLRSSEIRSVNIKNLDFFDRTLKVTGEVAKYGRERIVPLSINFCEILKRYVEKYQKYFRDGYLIYPYFNSRGNKITNARLRNIFNSYSKKAGIKSYYMIDKRGQSRTKYHLHTLRHYFVSKCFETGVPLKVISTWVGHKSIATTADIYTHLEAKRYNELIDKVF